MRKAATVLAWLLFSLGLGGWSMLVLLYSPALESDMRAPAAAVVGIVVALSLLPFRRAALIRGAAIVAIATSVALWGSLSPSNDREWATEVSETPWGEVRGDEVTIHNVRNFNYRTEQDFDVRYEDRTVRLSELSEVDISVTYWGSKPIAHIMVHFGFNDREFLSVSIETRKEKGEGYSAVSGFFRNYELAYVVADERDVIRLRTTYRNPQEQVYVLRTNMSVRNGQKLFLDYVEKMNDLRQTPKFYNTLTTNCTTQVLAHTRAYGGASRYNWQILLSGYVPEYLFANDALTSDLPLEDIMSRSLVNDRANVVGDAPDFSVRIRDGVPKPPL